jgi:hypothetical protein
VRRKLARAADELRQGGLIGLWRAVAQRIDAQRKQRMLALRRASRHAAEFVVRPHLLRRRVSHVYGPEHVEYGPDELLVISVVRNGALYVASFMDHYQSLGVAHCVFLDNGSTDDTVERLCAYPRVTVLRTDLPYAKYENTMKRYLAERFSPGRWHLCADIDELFDYPCSPELTLRDFLHYLNSRGFSAVVTQMLDMFSALPLQQVQSGPSDRLKDKYTYYDLSAVERTPYRWSAPFRPEIKMHWGGIRRTVFGTNNGLTKASLVRMDPGVRPFVAWHQATGAVLADVSCVLMHYPFVSAFANKVTEAARTGRYGPTTTDEYIAYANGLAQEPGLTLLSGNACRFCGLEALVADGFLVTSDNYRSWVAAHRTE